MAVSRLLRSDRATLNSSPQTPLNPALNRASPKTLNPRDPSPYNPKALNPEA